MTKDERQDIKEYAEQAIEEYKHMVMEFTGSKALYYAGIAKGYDELLDYILNCMD